MSDSIGSAVTRLAPARRMPPGSALVASASNPNPDRISSVLDVSASPVHVPAKRIEADLAGRTFPFAKAQVRSSPMEWSELMGFIPGLASVSFEANSPRTQSLYGEVKGGSATLAVEREDEWGEIVWTVTVAAKSRKIAERTMKSLLSFIGEYPPPPPPEPLPFNIVPVDFWMQHPSGSAMSRRRRIEVQKWDEVETNYPAALREKLGELMALEGPTGGKLVLFHGPPGTGKTRAILTLMSEWREWCGPSVVTDADRLFADATYLNSIVFDSEGMGWLLLVIEDGDEFMNVNGRESKGQSIARLLNLADGIVGQGINLLTLISTNVDMDQLNPAVVRSGRCMANLHFGSFDEDEANEWLAANGVEKQVEKPTSLADLYAIKSGKDPDEFVIDIESDDMETVVDEEINEA